MAMLKGRLLIWYKLPDKREPKITLLLIIMNHSEKSERAWASQLFAQVALTVSEREISSKSKEMGKREKQALQVDFKGFN